MKQKLLLAAVLCTAVAAAQKKDSTSIKGSSIDEIVMTGTLKSVKKSQSPVPVTIIPAQVLQKNSTSNVLDALYQVNGINPQVNCNMCNTSDIGVNGMPGPYTMVLIDGMPIVSSLSTVYGFSGIPNTIIDRIELVKGPASSLYGSEAIGGVINIITKNADKAPKFFADVRNSTWGEFTGSIGFTRKINDNISTLFTGDGYYFNTEKDQDHDGFMDKTLQKRMSLFNKWDFKQKYDRHSSIYARYYLENRHGGELNWNPNDRLFVDFQDYNDDKNSADYNADAVLPNGYTIYNEKYAKGFRVPRGLTPKEIEEWKAMVRCVNSGAKFADDMKYQESIFTKRLEIVGKYELPIEENITLKGSYNQHDQNSAYGVELFMAHQKTFFGQAYWNKTLGNHDLILGTTYRYVWFSDNTIASDNGKIPFVTKMPGIFLQDLWHLNDNASLLLGYRLDFDDTKSANSSHSNVVSSPRIAFKYRTPWNANFRASLGTGYRIVNIFSEDHRALSGQYKSEFGEKLKPEKSVSGNLDYEGRWATEDFGLTYDFGAYYTRFSNKIYPVRNDAKRTLVYYNVDGDEYARNIGASLDLALNFSFPLRITVGVSYNQAQLFEFERDDDGNKVGDKVEAQDFEFSPRWMGTYSASYDFIKNLTLDLTGNWRESMLLPTQGTVDILDRQGNKIGKETDPRPERSPLFTKVNLQLTKRFSDGLELYGGVQNLFNYVPKHLLVATNDPFGDVHNSDSGGVGGLQFDTEYNYTAQQGRTAYIGFRFKF